ncbi:hypothetical protein D3C84_1203440 [compost metagenome]
MRAQAFVGKQRPHLLAQLADQVGLELLVTAAQGRAEQLDAFAQHLRQIEFGRAPAHQADQHPTAVN